MVHPLYHRCSRCLNQPVTVHLHSGKSYCGILSRVTPSGLYLSPPAGYAASSGEKVDAETADNRQLHGPTAENVFFAPFFFPFGLIAGFGLGLVTGALIARPWGYGYGGYPRYYW